MIQIKSISKTFHQKNKEFKALDNISLEVNEGDIVGIIGTSGAGKSTLIRCVNLLEVPDSGEILIRGKDLTKLKGKQLSVERKKIGMIFQHFNLLSSKTVFDNIALPLKLDKKDKTSIKQKVTELLKLVGLEDKADQYPKNLSGGQKQRVAIARALVNDPYVLLCDEITSALDPTTTQSVLQLLRDINQRLKITILLITHEMDVVKTICNQVAILSHGRLLGKGTLQQLIMENQRSLKQFIHTETMSLPQELYAILQEKHAIGLHPVIEVELNSSLHFDVLIDTINTYGRISYKLLKADIEYIGNNNFGKVLLKLQGTRSETEKIIYYFEQNNIISTLRGYV
ncbi:MAG TPA: ATP-binding cassette domain-containing protein [Bacteroidia bacterium]|jgi:D-methionine transport system ATP-binding protein|nr:ATP-binding cassette domain-containing protein [Bacteroidia bacterium]